MSATTDATKAASASEEKVDRRVSLSKEKTDARKIFYVQSMCFMYLFINISTTTPLLCNIMYFDDVMS